jgi:hypothetical protein
MIGAPWPEPEVRARLAGDAELPAHARSIVKLARAAGWVVSATYSRGTVPKAKNDWTPGRVVDAILVKIRVGNMLVTMGWEDGKATTAWVVLPGNYLRSVNHVQARAILGALT